MKRMTEKLKANPIVTILVALIGSGLIGGYFTYANTANERDDNYIEKYIKTTEDCYAKISKLEKRISILENGLLDLPFPAWLKDKNFNIIWINRAYVNQILNPLNLNELDLIFTKGECLGDSFVELIIKNDREVLEKNKTLQFKEYVPQMGLGISYKFVTRTPLGGQTGVGGIWIQDNIKGFK